MNFFYSACALWVLFFGHFAFGSCATHTAAGFAPEPEDVTSVRVAAILTNAYRQYRSDTSVKAVPIWRSTDPEVSLKKEWASTEVPFHPVQESTPSFPTLADYSPTLADLYGVPRVAPLDNLVSLVKAHGKDSCIHIKQTKKNQVTVQFYRWVSLQRSVPEESVFRREVGASVTVSMGDPTLQIEMGKLLETYSEQEVQTAFAELFERVRLIPLQ